MLYRSFWRRDQRIRDQDPFGQLLDELCAADSAVVGYDQSVVSSEG